MCRMCQCFPQLRPIYRIQIHIQALWLKRTFVFDCCWCTFVHDERLCLCGDDSCDWGVFGKLLPTMTTSYVVLMSFAACWFVSFLANPLSHVVITQVLILVRLPTSSNTFECALCLSLRLAQSEVSSACGRVRLAQSCLERFGSF